MTSAFIEPSILPSQDPVMLHIVIEREIREVERKRIDLTQSGVLARCSMRRKEEYLIDRKVQGPRS